MIVVSRCDILTSNELAKVHYAPIALQTAKQYLEQHSEIELVRFVLWDAAALKAYERAGKDIFMSRK
jgi:hypothetical protein